MIRSATEGSARRSPDRRRARWRVVYGWLCALILATPSGRTAAAPAQVEPLDYNLLTHTLGIELLRAGAHSATGNNSYTFVVSLLGLLNTAEERNLDFAKRKKVVVEAGSFGDTSIVSLSAWKPDEKLKDYKILKIEGNAIRELAARTMTEFKAQESEILIQVDISMMMKKKKWLVLKADEVVAKASYKPIPATKFEGALRSNQDLVIEDDKGTFVRVSVRYDKPAVAATKDKDKDRTKGLVEGAAK